MANITDFFDPHNKDHIEAWKHLCKTGCWPENFLPEDIVIDYLWQYQVTSKLASEYVKAFDSGKIT
jgi:hypothetical protein